MNIRILVTLGAIGLAACGGNDSAASSAAAAAPSVPAQAAAADPVTGRISGRLGAGEIELAFWPGQSDHRVTGGQGSVSIMTRPVAPDDGLGSLSLGFEGFDLPARKPGQAEVSIRVLNSAPPSHYRADLDDGLQITLERVEAQGERLAVAGRISGELTRQEMISKRRSGDDTLPFDLRFDGSVAPLQ
jgi:hypothetical protein